MRYIWLVLSDEGPLSRGDPRADRARAGPTGAPRDGRQAGGQVERREALRPTSLGARGWRYQLREVGTLLPPPRVPAGALAPPAAPPPRLGSRGTGKPRTHCAARMRRCGCLKFESLISFPGRDAARSPCEALLRRTGTVTDAAFVTTPALQRTAPQLLRAALRPGNANPNANRRGCRAATNVASTQH
jgi:hypothetical protein